MKKFEEFFTTAITVLGIILGLIIMFGWMIPDIILPVAMWVLGAFLVMSAVAIVYFIFKGRNTLN